ncbi:hypothetical protein B0F90DRAFT_1938703 [Multifurca ochricompacta]|uniref:Uncharacterized protein n=1 Tax=Multifurca ochricompacta TaxID=376703 RepID=A0AAD4M2A0_9AGAM|nr:hypothetical protein B0F90DRAFT_1938703 [Multifurca ochricompacta]
MPFLPSISSETRVCIVLLLSFPLYFFVVLTGDPLGSDLRKSSTCDIQGTYIPSPIVQA